MTPDDDNKPLPPWWVIVLVYAMIFALGALSTYWAGL
jgi:hypothetical protein